MTRATLQVGGTLNPDRAIYIHRPEDLEFIELLRAREYVNVLAPRQMGKSSLMVRALRELRREEVATASIDLAAELASESQADAWFRGLLNRLARDFTLDVDVGAWWSGHADDTAGQKLQRFFLECVCKAFPAPISIVIFLDEIDSTLKLPFTDGLFTAIRGMYNERGLIADYNRIVFCLIGVATPNELIKDRRTTVYNVGKSLALRDFQAEVDDLSQLAASLADEAATGEALLDRVLFWTGGQPYLTMRLCAELANNGTNSDDVDKRVAQEFRSIDEMRTDSHFQQVLRFVDVRLGHGGESLALYSKILRGERVRAETTPLHMELELSGLVKRDTSGNLIVRNRIYARLFDLKWVKSTRPMRQAVKYRRFAIATAILLALALSAGGLLTYNLYQARLALDEFESAAAFEGRGDAQFSQGDLTRALSSYHASRAIRAGLAKSDPGNSSWQRDLSAVLNRIGNVQIAQGDYAGALKSYRESLEIMEHLVMSDPNNADWRRGLAVSLNRIGDLQAAQAEYARALASYDDSLKITDRLLQSSPNNADWQRDRSVSLNRIGEAQMAAGDLAGALKSYRESLEIIDRLLSSDPSNVDWQRDRSVSLERIGDLQRLQGNLSDALASYRDSLSIANRRQFQGDQSRLLNRIGAVLVAQGNLEEALASYREGLMIARMRDFPRDQSTLLNSIGEVLVAQGKLEEAFASYRESIAIITERLGTSDPWNARQLASSYRNLARAFLEKGDPVAASGALRQGREIMVLLTKMSPDNAQWKRDLAEFERDIAEIPQ